MVQATAELLVLGSEECDGEAELVAVSEAYLGALGLVERLHRLLLDVLKDEFERTGRTDLNSVQALLLFNIGEDELSAGDLKSRGYYQGSNVSYNLKKLVETGYLHHERSSVDRRSVRIWLTDKGVEMRALVSDLFRRHAESFLDGALGDDVDLDCANKAMSRLEQFWRGQIRYIY